MSRCHEITSNKMDENSNLFLHRKEVDEESFAKFCYYKTYNAFPKEQIIPKHMKAYKSNQIKGT